MKSYDGGWLWQWPTTVAVSLINDLFAQSLFHLRKSMGSFKLSGEYREREHKRMILFFSTRL